MNTNDLIRTRRKELKLSQKQVADYVGVSEATLSRWESGNIANMKRSRIAALAKILEISPSLIVGDADYIEAGLGSEKKEPVAPEGAELCEKDKRLIEWFRSLPPGKQKAILDSQDAPEGLT